MMNTKLNEALSKKAEYLSKIYGVSENVTYIIMQTGITVNYDVEIENNLLDMAEKELKLKVEKKLERVLKGE